MDDLAGDLEGAGDVVDGVLLRGSALASDRERAPRQARGLVGAGAADRSDEAAFVVAGVEADDLVGEGRIGLAVVAALVVGGDRQGDLVGHCQGAGVVGDDVVAQTRACGLVCGDGIRANVGAAIGS